ncbi:MAG: magnesium transporter, partial [Bacillota bacterium]
MEQNKMEELRDTLKEGEIKEIFAEHHPADIAAAITGLPDGEISTVGRGVKSSELAPVMEELEEDEQIRILAEKSLDEIVEIFSFMPADDVTDLMGAMPVNKRKQLLALMRSGKAERIKELLGYGPETAGGIMTKEYLALRESLNTRQAVEKIKEIGPRTEVIESIFVVNDKKELQGTVDLREVLSAPDGKTLGELAEKNFFWVTPDVDQEEVARAVARYDLPVVPVVSRKKRLLGIITFDDIIDVIEDE